MLKVYILKYINVKKTWFLTSLIYSVYITGLCGEYTLKNCIVSDLFTNLNYYYLGYVGNVASIISFIVHRCAYLAQLCLFLIWKHLKRIDIVNKKSYVCNNSLF